MRAAAPPLCACSTLRTEGAAPRVKSARHIPSAPERILDAPDMVDDYYLNLLDWSPRNLLAVALGPRVYVWDRCIAAAVARARASCCCLRRRCSILSAAPVRSLSHLQCDWLSDAASGAQLRR